MDVCSFKYDLGIDICLINIYAGQMGPGGWLKTIYKHNFSSLKPFKTLLAWEKKATEKS